MITETIIIIAFFGFLGIGLFLNFKISHKPVDYSKRFSEEIKNITNKIQLQIDKEKEEYERKLNISLIELKQEEEEQKANYNKRINQLEDDYISQVASLREKFELTNNQLIQDNNEKVHAAMERYQTKMKQEEAIYSTQLNQLKEEYSTAQAALEYQKKITNDMIQLKKEEINKLISHLAEEEKLKKEKDFYRIVLSDNEISDICHIKSFAPQLTAPILLYKLVWETYIKKGFDAMCGRVLGDKSEKCGIYKITNIDNGMVYIGQTRASFKGRWRTHCRRAVKAEEGTNNRLYTAMWEEGIEKFSFCIVEEIPKEKSADFFTERERFWIDFYKAKDFGYNSKI